MPQGLTTVRGQRHSCSRTWGQCSSCRCHRHIFGCRVLNLPSRSASHCLGPPTMCTGSHLGTEHRQTQAENLKDVFKRKNNQKLRLWTKYHRAASTEKYKTEIKPLLWSYVLKPTQQRVNKYEIIRILSNKSQQWKPVIL